MIKRILVPLDGSRAAEAVLPQVFRLLGRVSAEVDLLRAVTPPLLPQGGPLATGPVLEAEETAAREYLRGVHEDLVRRGFRSRMLVPFGSPSAAILDAAQAENASLIAMTTHGHSRLAHLLFGSVTGDVLRASPVPVLVQRPPNGDAPAPEVRADEPAIRNILVPMDTGPQCCASLPQVAEFARLFHAGVILVRVVEAARPELGDAFPVAETSGEREAARRQLDHAARAFLGPQVPVRVLAEFGEVAPTLLELCRSEAVDLVAMSTHGRSRWSQFLTGSVTEKMLQGLEIPLLAVRGKDAGDGSSPPGDEHVGTVPGLGSLSTA